MRDRDKAKEQLIHELEELRRRLAAMEGVDRQDRRAEEALRESEERFRKIFEEGPIGIVLVGTEGRIEHANRRFCEMLGYAESELVAVGLAGISHPDDWQRDLSFVSRLWRGEIPHFHLEKRYLRKDGQVVWAQVTASLMHNEAGRPVNNIGMIEDITERKQAEEALRKAHDELEEKVKERTAALTCASEELAMFRRFAEASGQGFSMADLDGRITYANPALCRMLGEARPEEVVGKHLSAYFTDQFNRLGDEEIRPALNERAYWEGELPMLSRQGALVPTWHHTFMIRDETGSPLRMAVVITDMSERRRARMALERERRTLEHMLRASDHERQLIAYDIHDGLAQQLAGAIMQFQIYDHQKDARPEDARKAFDGGMALLREAHCEARRLISGVRPPILDESGVMAAIAHLVHDPAFDRGPQIDLRSWVTFGRLAPVVENVIYRIVQEGLANARHHSKSPRIRISFMQRDDRLRIEIRDWGVGFDPKSVRESRYGLEGIRERARLLGGKCRIKSKPGEGTSIVVDLPVEQKS